MLRPVASSATTADPGGGEGFTGGGGSCGVDAMPEADLAPSDILAHGPDVTPRAGIRLEEHVLSALTEKAQSESGDVLEGVAVGALKDSQSKTDRRLKEVLSGECLDGEEGTLEDESVRRKCSAKSAHTLIAEQNIKQTEACSNTSPNQRIAADSPTGAVEGSKEGVVKKARASPISRRGDRGDKSTTLVLTCKGNFDDPGLNRQLNRLTKKLHRLLHTDGKKLSIKKVEPWNSVKVTFNIPLEAAKKLKVMAESGEESLKKLGIMAIQLEGDRVVSLTIAGKNNETTELILSTGPPGSVPSLSGVAGTAVPSASSMSAAALAANSLNDYVSQQKSVMPSLYSSVFNGEAEPSAGPSQLAKSSIFPGPNVAVKPPPKRKKRPKQASTAVGGSTSGGNNGLPSPAISILHQQLVGPGSVGAAGGPTSSQFPSHPSALSGNGSFAQSMTNPSSHALLPPSEVGPPPKKKRRAKKKKAAEGGVDPITGLSLHGNGTGCSSGPPALSGLAEVSANLHPQPPFSPTSSLPSHLLNRSSNMMVSPASAGAQRSNSSYGIGEALGQSHYQSMGASGEVMSGTSSGNDLNSFLSSPSGAGGALASIAAKVHPDQQQRERDNPLFYPSQSPQPAQQGPALPGNVGGSGMMNSAQNPPPGTGPVLSQQSSSFAYRHPGGAAYQQGNNGPDTSSTSAFQGQNQLSRYSLSNHPAPSPSPGSLMGPPTPTHSMKGLADSHGSGQMSLGSGNAFFDSSSSIGGSTKKQKRPVSRSSSTGTSGSGQSRALSPATLLQRLAEYTVVIEAVASGLAGDDAVQQKISQLDAIHPTRTTSASSDGNNLAGGRGSSSRKRYPAGGRKTSGSYQLTPPQQSTSQQPIPPLQSTNQQPTPQPQQQLQQPYQMQQEQLQQVHQQPYQNLLQQQQQNQPYQQMQPQQPGQNYIERDSGMPYQQSNSQLLQQSLMEMPGAGIPRPHSSNAIGMPQQLPVHNFGRNEIMDSSNGVIPISGDQFHQESQFGQTQGSPTVVGQLLSSNDPQLSGRSTMEQDTVWNQQQQQQQSAVLMNSMPNQLNPVSGSPMMNPVSGSPIMNPADGSPMMNPAGGSPMMSVAIPSPFSVSMQGANDFPNSHDGISAQSEMLHGVASQFQQMMGSSGSLSHLLDGGQLGGFDQQAQEMLGMSLPTDVPLSTQRQLHTVVSNTMAYNLPEQQQLLNMGGIDQQVGAYTPGVVNNSTSLGPPAASIGQGLPGPQSNIASMSASSVVRVGGSGASVPQQQSLQSPGITTSAVQSPLVGKPTSETSETTSEDSGMASGGSPKSDDVGDHHHGGGGGGVGTGGLVPVSRATTAAVIRGAAEMHQSGGRHDVMSQQRTIDQQLGGVAVPQQQDQELPAPATNLQEEAGGGRDDRMMTPEPMECGGDEQPFPTGTMMSPLRFSFPIPQQEGANNSGGDSDDMGRSAMNLLTEAELSVSAGRPLTGSSTAPSSCSASSTITTPMSTLTVSTAATTSSKSSQLCDSHKHATTPAVGQVVSNNVCDQDNNACSQSMAESSCVRSPTSNNELKAIGDGGKRQEQSGTGERVAQSDFSAPTGETSSKACDDVASRESYTDTSHDICVESSKEESMEKSMETPKGEHSDVGSQPCTGSSTTAVKSCDSSANALNVSCSVIRDTLPQSSWTGDNAHLCRVHVSSTAVEEPSVIKGVQSVAEPSVIKGVQSVVEPSVIKGIQSVAEPSVIKGVQSVAEPSVIKGIQSVADPSVIKGMQSVVEPSVIKGIQSVPEPSVIKGIQSADKEDDIINNPRDVVTKEGTDSGAITVTTGSEHVRRKIVERKSMANKSMECKGGQLQNVGEGSLENSTSATLSNPEDSHETSLIIKSPRVQHPNNTISDSIEVTPPAEKLVLPERPVVVSKELSSPAPKAVVRSAKVQIEGSPIARQLTSFMGLPSPFKGGGISPTGPAVCPLTASSCVTKSSNGNRSSAVAVHIARSTGGAAQKKAISKPDAFPMTTLNQSCLVKPSSIAAPLFTSTVGRSEMKVNVAPAGVVEKAETCAQSVALNTSAIATELFNNSDYAYPCVSTGSHLPKQTVSLAESRPTTVSSGSVSLSSSPAASVAVSAPVPSKSSVPTKTDRSIISDFSIIQGASPQSVVEPVYTVRPSTIIVSPKIDTEPCLNATLDEEVIHASNGPLPNQCKGREKRNDEKASVSKSSVETQLQSFKSIEAVQPGKTVIVTRVTKSTDCMHIEIPSMNDTAALSVHANCVFSPNKKTPIGNSHPTNSSVSPPKKSPAVSDVVPQAILSDVDRVVLSPSKAKASKVKVYNVCLSPDADRPVSSVSSLPAAFIPEGKQNARSLLKSPPVNMPANAISTINPISVIVDRCGVQSIASASEKSPSSLVASKITSPSADSRVTSKCSILKSPPTAIPGKDVPVSVKSPVRRSTPPKTLPQSSPQENAASAPAPPASKIAKIQQTSVESMQQGPVRSLVMIAPRKTVDMIEEAPPIEKTPPSVSDVSSAATPAPVQLYNHVKLSETPVVPVEKAPDESSSIAVSILNTDKTITVKSDSGATKSAAESIRVSLTSLTATLNTVLAPTATTLAMSGNQLPDLHHLLIDAMSPSSELPAAACTPSPVIQPMETVEDSAPALGRGKRVKTKRQLDTPSPDLEESKAARPFKGSRRIQQQQQAAAAALAKAQAAEEEKAATGPPLKRSRPSRTRKDTASSGGRVTPAGSDHSRTNGVDDGALSPPLRRGSVGGRTGSSIGSSAPPSVESFGPIDDDGDGTLPAVGRGGRASSGKRSTRSQGGADLQAMPTRYRDRKQRPTPAKGKK